MFKKIIISSIALLLTLSVPLQVGAAGREGVSVYLDGKRINFDSTPPIRNGSLMVPMRDIFENLGASLKWDNAKRSITAKSGDSTIQLTIGAKTAIKDGKAFSLNQAPVIMGNTTFVPLRFVSESLGTDVGWISETSTVTINSSDKFKFKVSHVRDGDTFEGTYLDGPEAGETVVVRMIGMDTPETVKENTPIQFYGPESSEHTKKILTGKTVYLVKDKSDDPYGRTLAYVFLENGSLYNADLVAEGYARALPIEPNTRWKDLFSYLETDAKQSNRGLWVDKKSVNTPENSLSSILEKKASEYGYANGEFHPEQLITEEQLLKFIIIALFPEAKSIFLAKSFYNLSQEEQFQQVIQYAIDAGLIIKDDLMNSNEPVTLNHALSILSRALKIDDLEVGSSLSDFGFNIDKTSLSSTLTMGDAILLVEKAKKVYGPLQEYFNHLSEAVKKSEMVEQLSSSLTDSALAEKLKSFAGNVKTSVSNPELLNNVKTGASELLSSLQSLLKGGLKDIISLTKIKKAVEETNKSLIRAEEALKEAQSTN